MVHTVRVPLDGSEFAEQALPYAMAIADGAHAVLQLVQVHALYGVKDSACSWMPFDPDEDAAFKRQEQSYLNEIARRPCVPLGLVVRSAVVAGMAADGILAHARAKAADLIVMTTHGRGPLSRVFLGSVASELVRRAPIPILLIRPRQGVLKPGRTPTLQRILVPLDLSAQAEQILGPATELAHLTGGSLTLLHVLEPSHAPGSAGCSCAPQLAQGNPHECRAKVYAYLNDIAERLRKQSLQVHTRIVVGSHAASVILEEVQAQLCDLLAFATHGRGGYNRLLLGSVAEEVLCGASIPVLISRRDGRLIKPSNGMLTAAGSGLPPSQVSQKQ